MVGCSLNAHCLTICALSQTCSIFTRCLTGNVTDVVACVYDSCQAGVQCVYTVNGNLCRFGPVFQKVECIKKHLNLQGITFQQPPQVS